MVAIIFPWAIIFANDNPLGALLALAMQATIIGWIPAVIWAWKIVHPNEEKPIHSAPIPPKTQAPPNRTKATTTKGSK